jgi:hypothetical protein
MAKTKYIARYDGKIVGTRKTERTYQFAVVTQISEARARDYAYNYKATSSDRDDHNYYGKVVSVGVGGIWDTDRGWTYTVDQRQFDDCSATWFGGDFDAYVAWLRERAIKDFEARLADGAFEPAIAGWCGRRDLAQKLAAEQSKHRTVLAIVPAELA